MKAPVGLLSDRTVLRSKMEGPRPDKFAFVERSGTMKAPVGLLSDRTVLRSKMEGLCPDKFAFAQRSGTIKSPVGTLSDRTVLRQQDGGASPRQVPVCRTALNSGKAPAFQKRMQGLSFCLLQDNFAVFTGIHHKSAAGSQRTVDQALGGGVFHGLADDAAQIARTKLAALGLFH